MAVGLAAPGAGLSPTPPSVGKRMRGRRRDRGGGRWRRRKRMRVGERPVGEKKEREDDAWGPPRVVGIKESYKG
jgi:hypothetical protein